MLKSSQKQATTGLDYTTLVAKRTLFLTGVGGKGSQMSIVPLPD